MDPAAQVASPPAPEGCATEVLRAYLSEHLAVLRVQAGRVRADGDPRSVHEMRIAARRLRSALRTYRRLLDDRADTVAEELRWLGASLSPARDAQVMRERLEAMVAAQPPELVLGPVWRRIDDELRSDGAAGRDLATRSLASSRSAALLDSLDDLVATVPPTATGGRPAADVLPGLLQREVRRLRRAIDAAADAAPADRDARLHEARKKAKRLRYAAESAVPVLGKRARRLALSAKEVQQALGEHQDSVVSRRLLREYGARTHLSGENGFTFGRLHALEEVRAAAAVRDFEAAWARLPKKKVRRWVAG